MRRDLMRAGLKVEQEVIGDGPVAEIGDRITIRLEIRLNHGDLVRSLPLNMASKVCKWVGIESFVLVSNFVIAPWECPESFQPTPSAPRYAYIGVRTPLAARAERD